METKSFFIIILLVWANIGFAQNFEQWEYLGKSKQDEKMYIREVQHKEQNKYTFWLKLEVNKNKVYFNYTQMDCEARTYILLEYILKNAKGKVISSARNKTQQENKILPDSMSDLAFLAVCKK